MSAPRKLRKGKSELTRLKQKWLLEFTDDQKAQFISWFSEAITSNEQIRARIRQRYGIALHYDEQLSAFRSWELGQARWDALGNKMEEREQRLASDHPDWSRAKIRDEVLKFAYAKSMAEDDMELGMRVVKADLREEVVQDNRTKMQVQSCELFLKWFADKKARDIAESNLSNADKIAAMRQALFADVDELERAGTVKLPDPK